VFPIHLLCLISNSSVDGVHDNLDPQQLGVPPPETKANSGTWEEAEKVDPDKVEAFKNSFRKKWLEDTFSKQLLLQEKECNSGKLKLDVKTAVTVLLQHCVNILLISNIPPLSFCALPPFLLCPLPSFPFTPSRPPFLSRFRTLISFHTLITLF
jgi:hypothetical protein